MERAICKSRVFEINPDFHFVILLRRTETFERACNEIVRLWFASMAIYVNQSRFVLFNYSNKN